MRCVVQMCSQEAIKIMPAAAYDLLLLKLQITKEYRSECVAMAIDF